MAASTEEPSPPAKLSPSERLVRKRAAARLRQQRCRARKRQALLEERRQQELVDSAQMHKDDSRPTQGSSTVSSFHRNRPSRFIHHRSGDGEYWSDSSSSSEPIHNCVSFDSQRSYEEAHKSYERMQQPLGTPMHRNTKSRLPIVSPPALPCKPLLDIGRLKDEGQSQPPLVAEEEAAVAAMLSLKTGPTAVTTPSKITPAYRREHQTHYRRHEMKVPRVAKYRYCNSWEPRRMESYEYPLPMRVHEYHPIPPPPPPLYRYNYPTYGRYDRREYE